MSEHIVWKFGDNVDTDAILPGRFLANWSNNPQLLTKSCFVDVCPEFSHSVRLGDIVVGGRNFGCGSSRESAPVSLKLSGIAMIFAESFGRIFYRNCINIGLLAITAPAVVHAARQGDCLSVDIQAGRVVNLTRHLEFGFAPFPSIIRELVELGGLEAYVIRRLSTTAAASANGIHS